MVPEFVLPPLKKSRKIGGEFKLFSH
jgi:hypothetical protein